MGLRFWEPERTDWHALKMGGVGVRKRGWQETGKGPPADDDTTTSLKGAEGQNPGKKYEATGGCSPLRGAAKTGNRTAKKKKKDRVLTESWQEKKKKEKKL